MSYATPSAVILIGVLFPVLGSVAVSLRFYTRHSQKAEIGIDDWLILPALVKNPLLNALAPSPTEPGSPWNRFWSVFLGDC